MQICVQRWRLRQLPGRCLVLLQDRPRGLCLSCYGETSSGPFRNVCSVLGSIGTKL